MTKPTELHSRGMVIDQTLGEELDRNSATLVAKLKADPNELSNSLKTTLDVMGELDEKMCQVTKEADEAKREAAMWKAEAEMGRLCLLNTKTMSRRRRRHYPTSWKNVNLLSCV